MNSVSPPAGCRRIYSPIATYLASRAHRPRSSMDPSHCVYGTARQTTAVLPTSALDMHVSST